MQTIKKFHNNSKNQNTHKRKKVTLLQVCRFWFGFAFCLWWFFTVWLTFFCFVPPSTLRKCFRKSHKFWTGSFMILIQLLPCLSKVPDQFYLISFRTAMQWDSSFISQINCCWISSSRQLAYSVQALYFYPPICLYFSKCSILLTLTVVASHMLIHLSLSHWISSTASH